MIPGHDSDNFTVNDSKYSETFCQLVKNETEKKYESLVLDFKTSYLTQEKNSLKFNESNAAQILAAAFLVVGKSSIIKIIKSHERKRLINKRKRQNRRKCEKITHIIQECFNRPFDMLLWATCLPVEARDFSKTRFLTWSVCCPFVTTFLLTKSTDWKIYARISLPISAILFIAFMFLLKNDSFLKKHIAKPKKRKEKKQEKKDTKIENSEDEDLKPLKQETTQKNSPNKKQKNKENSPEPKNQQNLKTDSRYIFFTLTTIFMALLYSYVLVEVLIDALDAFSII